MRIVKLVMLFLLASVSVAMAQQKKKALLTAKISTPTVQCESCKNRIERYMSQEEGVESVKVDYKKHVTTVKYWDDRTNIENVKTGIANAGYDADNVTANPESYAKLPKCCKKPEDGGGMEKKKH
ncbi:heavy-metal-associated domain-containing protein [Chitinophaga varians]|uniref:Heavy-metal-associated domain-containing protein n=4 Tax=Chitinophaga TaxID=79328 RepID=A0AAE6ZIY2_9BACT|nr:MULTISPECIES: heavy metal-associated domain-containing protein [Chitinophaga]MBC9931898.1 heavy-metal-associated domain-containing protein [Chitinophaga qingshengii]NLR66698.1 heavy-metal-associated domain-containing protein [Chitinophaga varians]QJB32757.1 heavy-metal-associated domain-containing protein [Chitinophaga oryzae]QJB39210.1 heavy-metal-associated domain-containing protein [Chitinophaga oryzae]SJZ70432.1 Copper chaperone CopZ [Chitinophaga eiseniae]